MPEGEDSSTPLAACCIPPLLHRRCGLSFFSPTTTHPPATSVGAVCCSSCGRAGVGLRPPAAGTRPGRPACISLLDEMRDARSTSAGICDSGTSPAAAPSRDATRVGPHRTRDTPRASRDVSRVATTSRRRSEKRDPTAKSEKRIKKIRRARCCSVQVLRDSPFCKIMVVMLPHTGHWASLR